MTTLVFERNDFGSVPGSLAKGVPGLDGTQLEGERPDAHMAIVDEDGAVAARCSVWHTEAPEVAGKTLGCVGHFAAANADAGREALIAAQTRLAAAGCDYAAGPMNGNTWRAYRFMTRSDPDVPQFFLEPWNPPEWPRWFEQNGWTKLAGYSSSRIDLNETPRDARVTDLKKQLQDGGVRIRQIDLSRYREELSAIHEMSVDCFAGNLLYTPLARDDFLEMYLQLESVTVPEFVFIAETDKEGKAIGFVFALPDAREARALGRAETLIVKTLAVLPERRYAGLGTLLVNGAQEAAREAGYRFSIHALQYESNASLRITSRYNAKVIREYTLYARDL